VVKDGIRRSGTRIRDRNGIWKGFMGFDGFGILGGDT
jgi:hypothetical protein